MAPTPASSAELRAQFGDVDIYLFDQLLRGRFDARRRILDAGCGGGRNLPYKPGYRPRMKILIGPVAKYFLPGALCAFGNI